MMDYERKEKDQPEEITSKFSIPGIGKGVKFPKWNPLAPKEKNDEEPAGIREPENPEEPERKKTKRREEPVPEEPLPELKQDRITITMLGISGSGKTMFLSGVYQSLIQDSCCGVSLKGDDDKPSADSALKVTGQIAKIALINNGNAEEGWSFPLGTTRTVEYPLRLLYEEEEVCGFDFLDYAGGQLGTLTDVREDSLSADQIKLLNQLRKSDELMIFADADVIAKHNVLSSDGEKALCRSELGVSTVQQLFNDLRPYYQNRPMTVLIILTKIDKVPGRMLENNCAELISRTKAVYKNLWDYLRQKSGDQENPWNIGIVPVTAVGRGNEVRHIRTVTERDGTQITQEKDIAVRIPEPENMDAAMVYSVAAIMKQRCQALAREESALIELAHSDDAAARKAAVDIREQKKALRKKMESYVIKMTQSNGISARILERNDVLGWWIP
jgi:ribosomal protein L17